MPDDWQPFAGLDVLRRRADLIARIRSFFDARGALEVETPLLASYGVTDVHLTNLAVDVPGQAQPRLLQTSPEYAMKRLIAAGSGPIYQIGKAFRGDERGRLHNPEFTMLEWYRPEFDHHALMDEMDGLLREAASFGPATRVSYGELFSNRLAVDPHCAPVESLADLGRRHGIDLANSTSVDGGLDRDAWLDLLMTHVLEPELGRDAEGTPSPVFIYDYPASQAALARVVQRGANRVAERFEVYVAGVVLANGFHELADPDEQQRRFEADLDQRAARGLHCPAIDHRLLAALKAGIGDCAGVALGIDRLLMATTGASHIDEVMAFPFERA